MKNVLGLVSFLTFVPVWAESYHFGEDSKYHEELFERCENSLYDFPNDQIVYVDAYAEDLEVTRWGYERDNTPYITIRLRQTNDILTTQFFSQTKRENRSCARGVEKFVFKNGEEWKSFRDIPQIIPVKRSDFLRAYENCEELHQFAEKKMPLFKELSRNGKKEAIDWSDCYTGTENDPLETTKNAILFARINDAILYNDNEHTICHIYSPVVFNDLGYGSHGGGYEACLKLGKDLLRSGDSRYGYYTKPEKLKQAYERLLRRYWSGK